jgi:hypothetical protein
VYTCVKRERGQCACMYAAYYICMLAVCPLLHPSLLCPSFFPLFLPFPLPLRTGTDLQVILEGVAHDDLAPHQLAHLLDALSVVCVYVCVCMSIETMKGVG